MSIYKNKYQISNEIYRPINFMTSARTDTENQKHQ